jgi:hypothetical protein
MEKLWSLRASVVLLLLPLVALAWAPTPPRGPASRAPVSADGRGTRADTLRQGLGLVVGAMAVLHPKAALGASGAEAALGAIITVKDSTAQLVDDLTEGR